MGSNGRISIAQLDKYGRGYNGKQLFTLPNAIQTTLNKLIAFQIRFPTAVFDAWVCHIVTIV